MRVNRSVLTWLLALVGIGAAAVVLERTTTRTVPTAPRRVDAALVQAPVIRGRREGCLVCHAGVASPDTAHSPARIGCAACHLGNVDALDARVAHEGMLLVPGNLADAGRTCAQATCHAAVLPRVTRSIMTTGAGIVEVNRRVFGEPADTAAPHMNALGTGHADQHLRQLCASCHLGQLKTAWGPIDENARGGGCLACHLNYDAATERELAAYQATTPTSRTSVPLRHPALTVAVDDRHCFGCHSRSGRISTNYEGWHELRDAPSAAALAADRRAARPQYRPLADGRTFTRVTSDVHQSRGMGCIDCHLPGEVMGRGTPVAHARDQVQIRCEDCHAARVASVPATHADAETSTLLALRGWTPRAQTRLAVAASGGVFSNVVVSGDSGVRLRNKRTGAWAPVRAPRAVCTQGDGHSRLSCSACHSAWAPRCATCHTTFDPSAEGFDHSTQKDVRGAWVESSGAFEARPPTLGIRAVPADPTHPRGVVDTFVPGMNLDLERPSDSTRAAAKIFRRLYARVAPHTTLRAARSCASCHADPVALGFGDGTLRFEISGTTGRWTFTPKIAPRPEDGIPADAWTGFLRTRRGTVSTRDDVRPFTADEQRRILTVGACLTCHAATSAVMQQGIADFDATLARRSNRCVVPSWP